MGKSWQVPQMQGAQNQGDRTHDTPIVLPLTFLPKYPTPLWVTLNSPPPTCKQKVDNIPCGSGASERLRLAPHSVHAAHAKATQRSSAGALGQPPGLGPVLQYGPEGGPPKTLLTQRLPACPLSSGGPARPQGPHHSLGAPWGVHTGAGAHWAGRFP